MCHKQGNIPIISHSHDLMSKRKYSSKSSDRSNDIVLNGIVLFTVHR